MEARKLRRSIGLTAALITAGAAGLVAVPAASAQQVALHVGPAGITHIGLHGVGSGQVSATLPAGTDTSTNWSGYAVTGGGPYKSVTTTWVQPAVDCSVTPNSYAAFWDGLDGFSSSTVEQDGTLAECVSSGGRHGHQVAEYLGWYETYPNPMYGFGGTVAANDTMTATTTSVSPTQFVLTLSDNPANPATKPWSVTTTQTLQSPAALSSAEVIAEAPSSNSGVLPLADFGLMNFSSASVDGATLATGPDTVPIEMVSRRGTPEAIPGALNGSGGFSVQWK